MPSSDGNFYRTLVQGKPPRCRERFLRLSVESEFQKVVPVRYQFRPRGWKDIVSCTFNIRN